MAIDIDVLLDEDIISFDNVDPTIGISTIDADDENNNNTAFKDKINEIIAGVIEADDNNVKLTGAQDVDGVKTFLKSIRFTSTFGIGDSFLLINAGGTGDSSIRFKDTLNAALHYDATNDLFKLLTDSATLTSYAKLKIAAGAAAEDATRYDQVPKLATTNQFTLANTFDVAITQSVAATSANHLIRKTEYDAALAALSLGGILQQSIAPSFANNTLWIDTTVAGIPTFLRGNGTTHDQIVWTVNPSTDIDLTGVPPTSATDSLLGLGIDIAGGSANGTFLGINKAAFTGNFVDFQVNGVSKFSIPASGAINFLASPTFSAGFAVAVSQTIDFNSNRLQEVGTPIASTDGVNKAYADALTNFNPMYVSGLTLWLKADSLTSLNDGDPVATWSDSSNLSEAFTEATNRPTYKASIINGKPVVRFDGTNDKLTSASAISSFISNSAYTVFIVTKNPAAFNSGVTINTRANTDIIFSDSTTYHFALGVYADAAAGRYTQLNYDGTLDAADGSSSTAASAAGVSVLRHTGGNIIYTDYGNSNTTTASGNTADLAGTLKLGTDGTNFGEIDIAEIIIYNVALDSLNIQRVRSYLVSKYGL